MPSQDRRPDADADAGVCPVCGATGQFDVFCASCGTALRDRAQPQPQPEHRLPNPDEAPSPHDAAEPESPAPLEPEPHGAAVPDEPAAPAQPIELRLRARELIVPVADPAAPGHGIVPVPPGSPQPARPTVHALQPGDVTGGVPCPWCSTPNPVDRHFCRRCAMSLASRPDPPVRLPWWRRIWLRISAWRRREAPYAGQRPSLRRGVTRVSRWAVAVAVAAVLAVEIDAHASSTVLDVEDHFAKPVQVYATSMVASHSDPAHPSKNLADGYDNTWWGTGLQGNGAGVYVQATFAQPINLLDVIITPGAGVAQDTFTQESRPQTLKVALSKSDGSSVQTTVTLNDAPGPETFATHDDDVTSVRFTIESAYLADVPGQTGQVAISEVEFFVRSAAR